MMVKLGLLGFAFDYKRKNSYKASETEMVSLLKSFVEESREYLTD